MSETYMKIEVRKDIALILKKIARHRGITVQQLLVDIVDESIDDFELDEIGFAEYTSRK